MKPKNMMSNHAHVVDSLRRLPRKMLQLHGLDNVTEFVLHDLSGKDCFNLHKAAYFIDNPDFNFFKGIAGVSHNEKHNVDDIWVNPDVFTQHMMQSPFNQQVRSLTGNSHKKNGELSIKTAEAIAHELGLDDYGFYSWDMKHNNHGFLVCEKNKDGHDHHIEDDIIIDGLSLLSFCPVH
jgi:hypothetical protein